jgi:hypothetical protein
VLRRQEPLFGDRFMGIVDHRTHELNFQQKIASGVDLPVMEMNGRYIEQWAEAIELNGEPNWRDDDPGVMFDRGVQMMELYHAKVSPKVQPVGVEERFEIEVPGVPVPLVGYIDVQMEHGIRERKTSAKRVLKPKPKWRFQGRLYQLATQLPVQWDVVTKQVTPQVVTADDSELLYMGYSNPDATVTLIQDTCNRIDGLFKAFGRDRSWPANGIFHDWACDYCFIGPRYEGSCVAWDESGRAAASASDGVRGVGAEADGFAVSVGRGGGDSGLAGEPV